MEFIKNNIKKLRKNALSVEKGELFSNPFCCIKFQRGLFFKLSLRLAFEPLVLHCLKLSSIILNALINNVLTLLFKLYLYVIILLNILECSEICITKNKISLPRHQILYTFYVFLDTLKRKKMLFSAKKC